MRLLSVSTEALLAAGCNIVAELQGSCSLRAGEMGGNGTKASSVAGSKGEGRDGAKKAHSAAWKITCRPSQGESPIVPINPVFPTESRDSQDLSHHR
jgi:hypothetical protein